VVLLCFVTIALSVDPYKQYVLKSDRVEAWFMPFGATMTRLFFQDKTGTTRDIILGFEDLAQYKENPSHPYFGAIVGRYANRIANGSFTLDGTVYHTPLNDKGDTLHGGDVGYDRRVWNVAFYNTSVLVFSLYDADLVESFPGQVNVSITYRLSHNDLSIIYEAVTDSVTIINLSSHTYWNLNGFANNVETVLDHVMYIAASKYTPVDSTLIPTGQISPVTSAPWLDFTTPKTIGKDIAKGTVTPDGGYDNNLVLDDHTFDKPIAGVFSPLTGITLELHTTQPGLQFYSANFLDGSIPRKKDQIYPGGNNESYQRYSAFAIETQHFPDSIHHSQWPTTLLRQGERFEQHTLYRFSLAP